jgi:multicomponent Na+:H+ antiporter subunit C
MMDVLPYVVGAWIFLAGLYGIVTSRNLIHLVTCLAVVQSSTYLVLLSVGYKKGGEPPVFADRPPSPRAVDPVVQALTLTDLVVSVVVVALLLSLTMDMFTRAKTVDPDKVRELSG